MPVPDAGGSDGGPGRSPAPFDAALAEAVASAFHDAHRALYGYDFRGDARQHVEWVNLRVTGVGPIARPALVGSSRATAIPARARTGSRPVCFGRGEEFVPATIFARSGLIAGDVIAGPAVIEEYGATVPLHPGFTAVVDEQGNLRISPGAQPAGHALLTSAKRIADVRHRRARRPAHICGLSTTARTAAWNGPAS